MGSILPAAGRRIVVLVIGEHGTTSDIEAVRIDRQINEALRRIVFTIVTDAGPLNIVAHRVLTIVICDEALPTDIIVTYG